MSLYVGLGSLHSFLIPLFTAAHVVHDIRKMAKSTAENIFYIQS